MKHSIRIRQRVLDPVTGLMVTKIEQVNGELSSGIFDCNGKEIFEGDIIRYGFTDREDTAVVTFQNGAFSFAFHFGDKTYPEISPKFASSFEVIGHGD